MLEFTPNFDPYEKLLQHQKEIADLQHNQVVLCNEVNEQARVIRSLQRDVLRLQQFIQNIFAENK